jgi:hypothetical protein
MDVRWRALRPDQRPSNAGSLVLSISSRGRIINKALHAVRFRGLFGRGSAMRLLRVLRDEAGPTLGDGAGAPRSGSGYAALASAVWPARVLVVPIGRGSGCNRAWSMLALLGTGRIGA